MIEPASPTSAALLRIVPVFGLILFGAGIYLVARDKAALGAAMFAVGVSQFAVFAALKAAAAKKAQQPEDRP